MSNARIHAMWPTLSLGAGLLLLYFGERVLAGMDGMRVPFAAIGGACVLAALIGRITELGAQGDDRRPVAKKLLAATLGAVVAVGLYGITAYVGEDGNERVRGTFSVLWPIVLICSIAPLVAIELAVAPVAFIDRYEVRKVHRSFQRGLALGLMVSCVFLANFLAKRHEYKVDLSSGTKAKPTKATEDLLRDLTKPVKVTLFYPQANEVAEALQHYFDQLGDFGGTLEVERMDQALAGKRANEAGVNENGYVAVSHEKAHEKIRVGQKLRSSRSSLRKFDSNFAKALIKVTRGKAVAYFTSGHGERAIDRADKDDNRSPVKLIKRQLEANRYDVKPLGVAEGLGNAVPEDATIILIMGPEKPFLPEELAALKDAIDGGARILIALEAERDGSQLDELLAGLGLKFDRTLLANEGAYVKVTQTKADRNFLYTNRYSSHESVTTMTRNANKLATLFVKTGSLEKLDEVAPDVKVDMVLTAMNATFRDADGDLSYDEDEKKKSYGLAAAVTKTATTSGGDEARVFVVADADLFSDKWIRSQGNPYLFGDIVYWLRDIKEPVLPTVTEEDVRIVHKRSEDALWFYSTTLGMPGLLGLLAIWRIRRRKQR